MDWSKGFSAEYYMAIVDPSTWRDVERVEITGGSVTRTASGLLQSIQVFFSSVLLYIFTDLLC